MLFLARLQEDLHNHNQGGLIFANFFAGRHKQQIDFLVITENCVCVVELKNYNAPVFGDINGPWVQKMSDGSCKKLGDQNPYDQGRNAKYSIIDEMNKLRNNNPELPAPDLSNVESVVCIFPQIPTGSQLPKGDFKTYIKAYPDFLRFLFVTSANPGWTKNNWLTFARNLGLNEPEDPIQAKAREYLARFLDYYGQDLTNFVPLGITIDGNYHEIESLISKLDAFNSLQLIGPSGCGKTFLSKYLAVRSISYGYAPIFITAKYFSGRLKDLLDRCIAPFIADTAFNLFDTLSGALLQPLLIIDGVNECPAMQIRSLLETLQAFILRQKCPILLTTQSPLILPEEIKGPTAQMSYLSETEKREVIASLMPQPPKALTAILPVLKTPYELFIAARSTLELGDEPTKYELFNVYARKCLERGKDSVLGFRILVKAAQILAERLCMALAQSEFKRIAEVFSESLHSSPAAYETIVRSGLIKLEQGYFSFYHEMIQHFFEAEALLSDYSTAADLVEEIEKPRNHHLAEFILGALGDINEAKILIKKSVFQNLLLGGMQSHYGSFIKAAILSDISTLFEKAYECLKELDLDLESQEVPLRLGLRPLTKIIFNSYEMKLLDLTGKLFLKGNFVDEILKLIDETDKKCLNLFKSKGYEGSKYNASLKSDLFASTYFWLSAQSLPVAYIFNGIRLGYFRDNAIIVHENQSIKDRFDNLESATVGILLFLCEILKKSPSHFVSKLPKMLKRCWETQIYHLRIEVLEAVEIAESHIDGPFRSEIITFLNEQLSPQNFILNTAIFETLARYEALETFVSIETAKVEVSRVLDTSEEDFDWDKEYNLLSDIVEEEKLKQEVGISPEDLKCKYAYNLYSKAFEDVFQGVYYEAIYDLGQEELLKFLTKAALGAPDNAFFTDNILYQLLKIDDLRALPAFMKWGLIPVSEATICIQFSVESYILSVIGLARHNKTPLRLQRPLREDEEAWQIYGEILFWLHKPSINNEVLREKCASCWQILLGRCRFAAVDPLMRIEETISNFAGKIPGGFKQLHVEFKSEVKVILETVLREKSKLSSLFKDGEWRGAERQRFIITMLEKVGDLNSIPILEHLLESPEVGAIAADAIRIIKAQTLR